MSRVAVLCTARPSFAKLQPICEALRERQVQIDLIAAAYAMTHNRSGVVDMMVESGWPPNTELHAAIDANTLESSALTTGLLLLRLTQHFAVTKPACVVIMADRHEVAAGAIAAAYQNIPLVHIQGGEVSGNIDDRVRRVNTALSSWHCVSNAEAYGRVIQQGAHVDRVFICGCPSIDLCRLSVTDPPVNADELSRYGTGGYVDPMHPFTLVMQHPDTAESPEASVTNLRHAVTVAEERLQPLVVFWPGADANSDASSKWLREYAQRAHARPVHLIRSLPSKRFLKLLSQSTYAVGNSSALIREASYFGIPRLILGDRQRGRAYSQSPSHLYGDGYASARIASVIQEAACSTPSTITSA